MVSGNIAQLIRQAAQTRATNLVGLHAADAAPGIWLWLNPDPANRFQVLFHSPEGSPAHQLDVLGKLVRRTNCLGYLAFLESEEGMLIQMEFGAVADSWSLLLIDGIFRHPRRVGEPARLLQLQ